MKKHFYITLILLTGATCFSQIEKKFGKQIFLPSIEMGYVHNNASALSGGIITKTSIEFRLRNNNDLFSRVNYDIHNTEYTLESINLASNIIKGKASFSDILAGLGYRFGDAKFRYFLMAQSGIRLYNYPIAIQNGNEITIEQGGNSIFMTRATIGVEYYFDEKSAVSFEVFQSQVWDKVDFWKDRGDGVGFSLGIITALF